MVLLGIMADDRSTTLLRVSDNRSPGLALARHKQEAPAQKTSIALHRGRKPCNVPVPAICRQTDRVAAWQGCIDEDTAEIEYHEVEAEP